MEWEDIIPQRGIRIEATPGVTVALRLPKDGRPHISASIGRAPLAALGWRPRQRVRVQVNAAAGLMRLSLTDDPALGYGLLGAASDSTVAVNIPLPGLPHDKRKAEGVENRIEGGALIFSLPAWARGARQEFAPARPAAAPASASSAPPSLLATAGDAIRAGIAARKEAIAAGLPPPPRSGKATKAEPPRDTDAADPDARDRFEAKQELRKGKSVRDVARDFGFRIALVASWHAEVLAEREKRRAA